MISFQEFLHGDGWTHPLLPNLTKATAKIVRDGVNANRKLRGTITIPSHQSLMLALAKAGTRGVTHEELVGLVDLDREVLGQLLTALIGSGEVALQQTRDGRHVYRRLV
jgi:hypothetical protein